MKLERAFVQKVAAGEGRVPSHEATAQTAGRLMQRLHDGPTQLMALALLELDQVIQTERAEPGAGMQELTGIRSLVGEALRDARRVLQEWNGGVTAEKSTSLSTSLINLGRRISSFTGLALHVDCEDLIFDPPTPVATILLQAVQELLLNTCKHAPGANVELVLTALADGLELTVSDNGPGFDPVAICQRHGMQGSLGLGSMPERLACVEASFNLQTRPGTGLHACIRWPGDFAEGGGEGRRVVRLPGRVSVR